MKVSSPHRPSGFTLVELLLAIAIMGVLAAIVIVAINPNKQLGDARNTQRKFDVNTILNAFGQYSIDSDDSFQPSTVDDAPLLSECTVGATEKKLCKATTLHGTSAGQCGHPSVMCAWSRHLSGAYIASIPEDPRDDETSVAEQAMVDYIVSSVVLGRFRVSSPSAENNQIIGASR